MSRWLLQWNPEKYDPRGNPITSWKVVRYLKELAAGDEAVLWRSGEKAGVCGIYRVTGSPVEKPKGDEDVGWTDPKDARNVRFDLPIEEVRNLASPITKAELLRDPRFARADILRAPFQANPFRLTDQQWAAITDRLDDR
jgi:predicted RNA-binding protein with PUA-like domain